MSLAARTLGLALAASLWTATPIVADDHADAPMPKLATLLRAGLEAVEGTEVIMSLVEIPAGMTLPTHYHPGEEFIYVLEGSGVIRLDGEDDIPLAAGDVFKVPLRKVHTAVTTEHAMKAVVFRVHPEGEPERIPVE